MNGKRNDNRMDKPRDQNFQWKKATKTLLFWILLFLGAVYIVHIFNLRKPKEVEITFTEYQQFLENGSIERANIQDQDFHGILKYEETIIRNGRPQKFDRFKTTLPFVDRDMVTDWDTKGLRYEFRRKSTQWWGYLISMLPWLLIIFLYLFFLRRFRVPVASGLLRLPSRHMTLLVPQLW